ncbi:taste receptor type 2 member 8-like [Podarcis lilfordi]|uniref:Taste receptor type 2 member 40 n=1 Tax=Podarcis lilfordi TaxID=74358 RepID=A0AA35LIM1_9SAUR|nr:taste receptor type 2 member 8-like [Podarcis lilfordi]
MVQILHITTELTSSFTLRKMPTLFELFNFILLVVVTLTGLAGNGFIAIVNCIDWFRSRKLSPADMILSCLSLFRFAFLAIVIQTAIFILFFEDTFQKRDLSIAYDTSWLFVNTAELCFAALLSILYCVKIANFSHSLFLQMKWRFPGLVPWLLLGTVVYSALATIVGTMDITLISECSSYESLLGNNTDSGIKTSDFCKYSIFLYVVPELFPFMIFLFSSILLLTSLWRHKNLLRNTAKDVSTEAHLNAIKALASFCILYISSFFVEILDDVLSWMDTGDLWVTIFFFNVIAAYSSGHAIILIFINPRLKQESIEGRGSVLHTTHIHKVRWRQQMVQILHITTELTSSFTLRKMPTLFELFCFILLVVVTLTGLAGNGFIAIVNCIDWFRSRKLSPADMILSSLSLFRFAFLAVVIQIAILILFFKDTFLNRDLITVYNASWFFVNTTELWFAAWLSVLYCVKIANFSHPLFLRMKRRFPGLVPWLLLGTVVFSAIITTIKVIMGNRLMYECKAFESLQSNNTDSGMKTSDFCKYSIFPYVVPDFFPFIIFFSSSILLLTSLWRHKNLLRNTARDVSTEVHLNAIKALASFCILYGSNFFVIILETVLDWMDTVDLWVKIFFYNMIAACSSGHAIILIFINPKQKKESVRILHQLKSCMKTPS